MKLQARGDTAPELALRSRLFADGFRYRVHYPVPGMPRRSVDIAFPRVRLAVFVDGCYWHGCERHKSIPVANREWWRGKIAGNRRRDRDTDEWLMSRGWLVMRVWEHESPDLVARRIKAVLNNPRP